MKITKLLLFIFLFTSNILIAQQLDLKFYQEQAIQNSPLIHKANSNKKIIQFDLLQIKRILYNPQINFETSILFAPILSHDNNSYKPEWTSNGAINYTGYDLALSNGGQYQAIISAKQEIFTKSKFAKYSDKAEISKQIAENEITLTVHEIEQLVSNQYIICEKSKLQSENSLMLLNKIENQIEVMRKLVDNAIYKQTDFLLLQIEYQNYENENETYKAQYRNDMYDLNLLCGINDTNLTDIKNIEFQLKTDFVENSQFLKSYKLDSLSLISEQKINNLNYRYQLNFFFNSGLNAIYQPDINRLGFSTGIKFSLNIYDRNQRKIFNEKSQIGLQTIEFEKRTFITQYNINKNKILNQINSLNQRIILTENQLNQYDKLLKMYNQVFSQGEISMMDFKNLLKDISSKEQENILLKMERQSLINSYNYWNY